MNFIYSFQIFKYFIRSIDILSNNVNKKAIFFQLVARVLKLDHFCDLKKIFNYETFKEVSFSKSLI